MKTTLKIAVLVALCLLPASCKKDNGPKDNPANKTEVTLRYVASPDFLKFYDVSLTYSVGGQAEKTVAMTFDKTIDESFIFAKRQSSKDIFKACTVVVKDVPRTGSSADRTVTVKLSFKRTSAAVDESTKYSFAFGSDIATYDTDLVAYSGSNIFVGIGVSGSMAEEYLSRKAELYSDALGIEIPAK